MVGSNEEQMSLVIRCMDDSVDSPTVQEYWIEFLKVNDSSGLGFVVELKNVLKNFELDIDNIRSQGYDNEANMNGRHRVKNMDINEAIKFLQALILFLEYYKETGFASTMDKAKQMASEMGIEASMYVDSLLKSCKNLEQYLKYNEHSNIIGDDLCSKLIVSSWSMPVYAIETDVHV
ncbi:uncharacterized protein LOC111391718 [Olea europaea var. sylvestris]|uniref:uncharacterized protein LOC111391718 n=1 Tax=Olea europaea var. sylvestris TaxID=158386 RepID=UPI000C1D4EEE|nr:uncharacterized protein LOC111391718 [Olea europaea var. sylvestris]